MIKYATIPGSPVDYKVHPECKKYTLRDNGFTETKTGKFQLVRSLNFGTASKKNIQLKIVIGSDLSEIKIYTTLGMQKLDLYTKEMYSAEKGNAENILKELTNQDVLQEKNA